MNSDILGGTWHQLKGSIKQRWGRLTDDDLLRIEGNLEEAAGCLQKRYGQTREQADDDWKDFCASVRKERRETAINEET
jgi:uncharacterized protein YjbJ (UPF0337 family)